MILIYFSWQLSSCSICYNANRWDLCSKYAERFVKAGVKLHRTAFDICMEFAAKVGKQFGYSLLSSNGISVQAVILPAR
jgi:hypothetical protein